MPFVSQAYLQYLEAQMAESAGGDLPFSGSEPPPADMGDPFQTSNAPAPPGASYPAAGPEPPTGSTYPTPIPPPPVTPPQNPVNNFVPMAPPGVEGGGLTPGWPNNEFELPTNDDTATPNQDIPIPPPPGLPDMPGGGMPNLNAIGDFFRGIAGLFPSGLGGFGQPMGFFPPGTAGPGPLPTLPNSAGTSFSSIPLPGAFGNFGLGGGGPIMGGPSSQLGGITGQGIYGSMHGTGSGGGGGTSGTTAARGIR